LSKLNKIKATALKILEKNNSIKNSIQTNLQPLKKSTKPLSHVFFAKRTKHEKSYQQAKILETFLCSQHCIYKNY